MEQLEMGSCKDLPTPTVVESESIGMELHGGKIYGTMGAFYYDEPGSVYIDPLMNQVEKWHRTAVIIHEMVHYIDWNDGGYNDVNKDGKVTGCDSEERAHAIAAIWMIENGHPEGFIAEDQWRSWYGC
jgi:hypothetical protein